MKKPELQIGDLAFSMESGSLIDSAGNQVPLRFQAREVLRLLASRPNEVVERALLLSEIWQDRQSSEDGLVQCIAEIRKALGDANKAIVETIPRKGYRLVVNDVREPGWMLHRRREITAAVLAILAIAALGVWALRPADPGSGRSLVAVLPFEELGPSEPDYLLSDAVSEDIITSLARYSEFDVVARHSSFQFRETSLDLRKIATRLAADYLVQGSQLITGRTLRISVQLIDARDLTNVWVDRFDVPLDDFFEVNDTIAHRIAHEVSSSVVTLNATAPRPQGEIDALIVDNRVRHLFQSAPRRESWIEALDLTQQSIDWFPESEWGYLGRALMLRVGVRFGWSSEDTEGLLSEAETLAQRAVELGPQNYMSHFALGRVLMQTGEVRRSVAALEAAAALNPSSILVLNALGQAYLYSDRLDEVDRVFNRIARIDPIQDSVTLWLRAWADWQRDACADALGTMQAMPVIRPEAMKLLAVIQFCIGDTDAAAASIGAFLNRYPDWTLAREIETNARNWTSDDPRKRWLAALANVGIPG